MASRLSGGGLSLERFSILHSLTKPSLIWEKQCLPVPCTAGEIYSTIGFKSEAEVNASYTWYIASNTWKVRENNYMSKQLSLTVTVMQLGIRASTVLIQLLRLGPNLHSKWEAQHVSNVFKKTSTASIPILLSSNEDSAYFLMPVNINHQRFIFDKP